MHITDPCRLARVQITNQAGRHWPDKRWTRAVTRSSETGQTVDGQNNRTPSGSEQTSGAPDPPAFNVGGRWYELLEGLKISSLDTPLVFIQH